LALVRRMSCLFIGRTIQLAIEFEAGRPYREVAGLDMSRQMGGGRWMEAKFGGEAHSIDGNVAIERLEEGGVQFGSSVVLQQPGGISRRWTPSGLSKPKGEDHVLFSFSGHGQVR
jgi:hypothetical protein